MGVAHTCRNAVVCVCMCMCVLSVCMCVLSVYVCVCVCGRLQMMPARRKFICP